VTPIVGDANQRPAVSRNDDVRTCTENSVDRAALEAELAQVGSAQYRFGLLKSLREHRLHATIFPITCPGRRFAATAIVVMSSSPLHDQPAWLSFARHTARPIPIAGAKRAFDSSSRVTAPVRDLGNRVLLLERKPRRQRAEPAAGTSEGLASLRNWIVR